MFKLFKNKGGIMIYLMQVLKMIPNVDDFLALFSDLDHEINELGYEENELVSTMLFNHYGIEIQCDKQLTMTTKVIMVPEKLECACSVEKMRRGK